MVEVAPQYDATTNTAQAGAQMLFEILSLMVYSPSIGGRKELNAPPTRTVAGMEIADGASQRKLRNEHMTHFGRAESAAARF